MPMEYMDTVAQLAKEHNMKLHLDGSRIWNVSGRQGRGERRGVAAPSRNPKGQGR